MRSGISRLFRPLLMCASLAALTACATPPPASDADALQEYRQSNDPLEPTNRVFYAINHRIDRAILRPAAIVYRHVPQAIRTPIHNVLDNLGNPVVFGNDVLQGKPRRAGDTFMRFLINTTVGLGGFIDWATGWGYPSHDADFGITLALWGVPNGPFLFLPILGPSSPRELSGFIVTATVADPFFYPGNGGGWNTFRWSRTGVSAVDSRERFLDQTDNIEKQALDPYATFRSLYQQHRQGQIDDVRNDNRATTPIWFSH